MKKNTIIVKYGSACVAGESGVDRQKLHRYAQNLINLNKVYNVVLVCSGSVVAGKSLWNKNTTSLSNVPSIQVLAMLGSATAFTAWQEVFLSYSVLSGQLLVTHREVDDPTEGPSLRSAIEANMSAGVITIINENDALSDTELAKLSYGGDNDGLAAHIAVSLRAETLILLTNVEGLVRNGKVVKSVKATAAAWSDARTYVNSSVNVGGRGGMLSKVEAAIRASKAGIEAYIANAQTDTGKILNGKAGTHFAPEANKR